MEPIIHKKIDMYSSNTTPSFANPLYWKGQQNTHQDSNNEPSYMDVSMQNYLPEYSSMEFIQNPNSTYFDVDAPPLHDKKNKTYLDPSDDAPPLHDKKNKTYLDTSDDAPPLPDKQN